MKVIAIRWWLTGPTRWQADLIGADGRPYRPGYDVPEQGIIVGASTEAEARKLGQIAVDKLAERWGIEEGTFDQLATTMLWDETEETWKE